MNKSFVIQWKSRVNGRAGRGTKLFGKEEAERLVEELNREYPQIQHEIVEISGNAQEERGASPTVPNPAPLFSIA